SLPPYVATLQRPCAGAAACGLAGALDAPAVQGLQAGGGSLRTYATYTLVLTLAGALGWAGIGPLIFWRRSGGGIALLSAAARGCCLRFPGGPAKGGFWVLRPLPPPPGRCLAR